MIASRNDLFGSTFTYQQCLFGIISAVTYVIYWDAAPSQDADVTKLQEILLVGGWRLEGGIASQNGMKHPSEIWTKSNQRPTFRKENISFKAF